MRADWWKPRVCVNHGLAVLQTLIQSMLRGGHNLNRRTKKVKQNTESLQNAIYPPYGGVWAHCASLEATKASVLSFPGKQSLEN